MGGPEASAIPFAGRLAPHPKGSASCCAPSVTSSYLSPPNNAFVRSLSHSETFFIFLVCIGLSQTLGWSWHSRLSDLVLPPPLGPFSLTLCLHKIPTLPMINFNPASPRHPPVPACQAAMDCEPSHFQTPLRDWHSVNGQDSRVSTVPKGP